MLYKLNYVQCLIFCLLLISCKQGSKVELPMEEDKVIALLGDMHFATSASKIHRTEERDSMKLVYESQVFVIHNTSREDYKNLIKVLESDINLYYEIEKKVHNYLKDIQNNKS